MNQPSPKQRQEFEGMKPLMQKLQTERDALASALLAAYDTMGLPPGCTIEPSIEKAIEDYKVSLAALKAEWRQQVLELAASLAESECGDDAIKPPGHTVCDCMLHRFAKRLRRLASEPKRKED
jgi:hypothetical protein